MYGLTGKPAISLIPLAKSWNSPPPITNTTGCSSQGYKPEQRAYALTANVPTLSFTVKGSNASPIVNPCFVIKNWDSNASASLKIDGKAQEPGPNFHQGIIRDTDGTQTMLIWIKTKSTNPINISISPATY